MVVAKATVEAWVNTPYAGWGGEWDVKKGPSCEAHELRWKAC